jgi:hypothetical protein
MPDGQPIQPTQTAISLQKLRQEVFDYAAFRLGAQLVDVELDSEHYETALSRAIDLYRMRSSNAVEESYAFFTLQHNVQEYTLPEEITHVKQLYRRTIGHGSNDQSNSFEPFEAGWLNTYLLSSGQTGGLLSYELFTGYQDLTARMFGGYLNFTFNIVTKKLTLIRKPEGSGEIVLMQTYNLKPEVHLLSDYRIKAWLKECTYSYAKAILGEGRSKFAQIAGPQGGSNLNGSELKQEAFAEIQTHIEAITNYTTGETPLGMFFG